MVDQRVSLSWHTVGGIMVVRVGASVSTSTIDREMVAEKLHELAGQSSGKIVVNMEAMQMLDSTTLAAIVSLNRKLDGSGGQLRMCRVEPLVEKMLDTFGLLNILKIDETEGDSIAALQRFGEDKASP